MKNTDLFTLQLVWNLGVMKATNNFQFNFGRIVTMVPYSVSKGYMRDLKIKGEGQ